MRCRTTTQQTTMTDPVSRVEQLINDLVTEHMRQVFAAEAVTGVRWETDIVQKDGQWSMVAYPTDQRL